MSKIFSGVYIVTVYVFTISDFLSNPKNLRKEFQTKELIKKITKPEPPARRIENFSKIYPIYDFSRGNNSDYQEHFWKKFWGQGGNNYATHFPFRSNLEGGLGRLFGEELITKVNESYSKLIGRFFPHGVITFHLREYVKFKDGISSDDIINFLELPIAYNHKSYTKNQFFSYLKSKVQESVINKNKNYPIETTVYHIIHPDIPKTIRNKSQFPINLDEHWNEIAKLLAISSEPRYCEKYTQNSVKDTSKFSNQRIYSSPFSTVILASDFKKPFHGKRCLRNRLVNISELILSQDVIAKQHNNTLKRLTSELRLQGKFDSQSIKKYMWDRMNKDQFFALNKIYEFQNAISNQQWLNWYVAIGSGKVKDFRELDDTLEDFLKANEEIGENAKKTIKEFTEYATKAISPIKQLVGMFGAEDS